MIMILFSHCQGHRLSSGSVAGAKVFERDNRGNFLYNVADEGIAGITVRRFYFATAVFALFLCEILIKFYTQWQF